MLKYDKKLKFQLHYFIVKNATVLGNLMLKHDVDGSKTTDEPSDEGRASSLMIHQYTEL